MNSVVRDQSFEFKGKTYFRRSYGRSQKISSSPFPPCACCAQNAATITSQAAEIERLQQAVNAEEERANDNQTAHNENAKLRGQRDAALALVERLTKERDEAAIDALALRRYSEGLEDHLKNEANRADDSVGRALTLTRLLAEATGALEPFAEASGALDDNHRDGSPIWETAAAMGIDAVHLRAAAAVLSNIRGHNG